MDNFHNSKIIQANENVTEDVHDVTSLTSEGSFHIVAGAFEIEENANAFAKDGDGVWTVRGVFAEETENH